MAAFLTPTASSQDTPFTYQGQLEQNDAPANGNYDMRFSLFAGKEGEKAVAGPVFVDDIEVTDGVFTTEIDLGASVFGEGELWLEIQVREGGSTGGYTILAPRQKITGTPLALHALTVADNAVDSSHIASGAVTRSALAPNSVYSSEIGTGAVGSSEIADNAVGASELADNAVGASELTDNSVGASKIANGSIDGPKLVDDFRFVRSASREIFEIHNRNTLSGIALDVVNEATSTTAPAFLAQAWRGGPAIWGQSFGLGGNDRVLVLQNNTWSGTPGVGGYTPNTVFEVEGDGDVNTDGTLNTGGADFAEAITASGSRTRDPESGDVMVIDTDERRAVRIADAPESSLVAGVYSTEPGVVGRTEHHHLDLADHIPLALVGIVPCKASAENGPIEPGDLLVTAATAGHAMRASSPSPGTILGKALEPLDQDRGEILVLLSLQ